MARLAAPVLLGQEHGVPLLAGALSQASPELAGLIVGPGMRSQVTPRDTEAFAFLVQERGGQRHRQWARIRRWLRQLRPLLTALREAVPEPDTVAGAGGQRRASAELRLYRRVIEIRSAQLALRPCQDPQVSIAADAAGRAAGLAGDDLAAAVEAAVITDALRAHKNGAQGGRVTSDMSWVHWPEPDLYSEAAWLARVSQAFVRSQVINELAPTAAAHSPRSSAPAVLGERPHRR